MINLWLISSLVDKISVIPDEAVIPKLITKDIQVELSLIKSAIRGNNIKALKAINNIPNTFSITLKLIIFLEMN